jgi:hypothetical protein
MGQTLRSILVGVLLCIVVATGIVVSCLLRGTYCQWYLAFVSTAVVVFLGVEADTIVAVAVRALALRALSLTSKVPLLLTVGMPKLLFPA